MINILKTTLISFLIMLSSGIASGQRRAIIILPESKVFVRGTSSLHDWEVTVKEFNVEFYTEVKKGELSIEGINSVFLGASVTSNNNIMTGKTHDALMIKEHPEISFKSSGIENLNIEGGLVNGRLVGELRLAGVTRNISVAFTGTMAGDKFQVRGSQKINMADFNIKPPTAMLGTLKTGEVVTVDFDFRFLLDR